MKQQLEMRSRQDQHHGEMAPDFSGQIAQVVDFNDKNAHNLCRLAQVVEGSIVPQLVLNQTHDFLQRKCARPITVLITEQIVDELVDLSLLDDPAGGLRYVHTLQARGLTVESLYLNLLAPAAWRLGVRWEYDIIDFAAVTLATWRLQHILRMLSSDFISEVPAVDHGYRSLIMTAPGEQHSFGLVMLSEFFRRGGWTVSGGPGVQMVDAARLVRDGWFDMIGFSLSSETGLSALGAAIERLKKVSRNRSVLVMVGGRVFVEHPELAIAIGGTAAGPDAQAAVIEATHLLDCERLRQR